MAVQCSVFSAAAIGSTLIDTDLESDKTLTVAATERQQATTRAPRLESARVSSSQLGRPNPVGGRAR